MSWWQTEENIDGSITVTDEWHGNPSVVLDAPNCGCPDVRRDQDGNRWDRSEDGSWHESLWP